MKNLLVVASITFILGISLGLLSVEKNEKSLPSSSGAITTKLPDSFYKEARIVGNILKGALENYHFSKKKIDDALSEKAFDKYIERLDYSKQYFYQSDIKKLEAYKKSLDDEMVSGDLAIVNLTKEILKQRVSEAEALRVKVFAGTIDLNTKESLELDPKKLKFAQNEEEWNSRWLKTFRFAINSRYLMQKDEQEHPEKLKKQKYKAVAKSNEKKKSDEELKKDAIESISKKYKKLFERVLTEHQREYSEKFFNAITTIFDPHTNYLPPRKKEDFDIDISGSLEGIGAVLSEEDGFIKVVEIIPGGAAWRQKELQIGDLLLTAAEVAKEPVDLIDMRVDDAVRYIRGKKGTTVILNVKKVDGSRKTIAIVRDVVKVQESFAKSSVLSDKKVGKKIGYIQLPKFYRDFEGNKRNCSADVKNEIKKLVKHGVEGIILDLRNNGGGALEDARLMSGFFFEKGPVVQVRDHQGGNEILEDTDPSIEYAGPLIVLVNRYSASASEIVAAALQDYNRAVIVGGEFTHGKGTVQAVLPLNQGPIMSLFANGLGALKITTQKFYRVSGGSTQFKGIVPDIILPDVNSFVKSREQDMDFALPWDEVKKLNYTPLKSDLRIKSLKVRSAERVSKNARFDHINGSLAYLKSQENDTNRSIALTDMIERDKAHMAKIESFKLEEENNDIVVSNYQDAIFPATKDRKATKESLRDMKEREENWIKMFRQDPVIEETLNIMHDMINPIL